LCVVVGVKVDPKKQRQAKTKAKKSARAGLYRDDGKRYKTKSLSKLDEKHVRLPSHVTADELKVERLRKFKFPKVDASELRLTDDSEAVIACEGLDLTPDGKTVIVRKVSVSVGVKSRIAVVGSNGVGQSELFLFCDVEHS
jgi:ATPase subunit of ABC transporter with duplicated ATPase domains